MGFLTGRVTCARYHVTGQAPALFGPEQLDRLAASAVGSDRVEPKDGVTAGWIAGEDILDTEFGLAKNIINDALHCSIRVDTKKLPGDLLRAYTRTELQALAAENPSGRPSARQKKEAKEAAVAKLEHEAKDGRFTRRKAYPVLWDRVANVLLVGTTSAGVLDRVSTLFTSTFGLDLVPVDAGQVAGRSPFSAGLADLGPSRFVGSGPADVSWVADPASTAWLGNEFLLWLWFALETASDTLVLPDGSEAAVMLVRTLGLECPRAVSGSETIRSDAPCRLPEARRAVQAGKLPRQAGLTVVRHDQQYELTLQAESLAVSGAKLPQAEESDDRARAEERVQRVRHLLETVDLVYGTFLRRRLSPDWGQELDRLRGWLGGETGRLAAAG